MVPFSVSFMNITSAPNVKVMPSPEDMASSRRPKYFDAKLIITAPSSLATPANKSKLQLITSFCFENFVEIKL